MEQTVSRETEEVTPAERKLSPSQQIALRELLEGKTHAEAGAKAGVTSRCVRYWVQQPAFRAALREGQDGLFREACTLLHFNAGRAVSELWALTQDKSNSDFARAWAARALVDLVMRSVVPDEQSAELAEIREQLAEIRRERDAQGEKGEGCGA